MDVCLHVCARVCMDDAARKGLVSSAQELRHIYTNTNIHKYVDAFVEPTNTQAQLRLFTCIHTV
jgi:hypothetical protein